MKLRRLHAERYRILRDVEVEFGDLNVFIGANASGKSTILDALRFLSEGVRARDFRMPTARRGGMREVLWKGARYKERVALTLILEGDGDNGGSSCEWTVRFGPVRGGRGYTVAERAVERQNKGTAARTLLEAENGSGWWLGEDAKVTLEMPPTGCALAAAAADASFPARNVAAFIERWGFFDPNPPLLRRDRSGLVTDKLDPYGRNLAETLYNLDNETLKRVVDATRSTIGLPDRIEAKRSPADDSYYFMQHEAGLPAAVHRTGVSSGTLRTLALMTALIAAPDATLIGIEEPENNVHPAALSAFVEHIRSAQRKFQVIVATHSPLLLNFLDEPKAVRVVRREGAQGARVLSDEPAAIRRAFDESGFGLGEYYETIGFGAA